MLKLLFASPWALFWLLDALLVVMVYVAFNHVGHPGEEQGVMIAVSFITSLFVGIVCFHGFCVYSTYKEDRKK